MATGVGWPFLSGWPASELLCLYGLRDRDLVSLGEREADGLLDRPLRRLRSFLARLGDLCPELNW